MTKKLFVLAVFLCLAALGFAQFKVGDTVLAMWSGDTNYYVATLAQADNTVKGGGFLVVYRDADQEVVPLAQIRPFSLAVGSKVQAMWSDGAFYPGTINKIVGEALYINFDDGDKGWTSWAGIRISAK